VEDSGRQGLIRAGAMTDAYLVGSMTGVATRGGWLRAQSRRGDVLVAVDADTEDAAIQTLQRPLEGQDLATQVSAIGVELIALVLVADTMFAARGDGRPDLRSCVAQSLRGVPLLQQDSVLIDQYLPKSLQVRRGPVSG